MKKINILLVFTLFLFLSITGSAFGGEETGGGGPQSNCIPKNVYDAMRASSVEKVEQIPEVNCRGEGLQWNGTKCISTSGGAKIGV